VNLCSQDHRPKLTLSFLESLSASPQGIGNSLTEKLGAPFGGISIGEDIGPKVKDAPVLIFGIAALCLSQVQMVQASARADDPEQGTNRVVAQSQSRSMQSEQTMQPPEPKAWAAAYLRASGSRRAVQGCAGVRRTARRCRTRQKRRRHSPDTGWTLWRAGRRRGRIARLWGSGPRPKPRRGPGPASRRVRGCAVRGWRPCQRWRAVVIR
jgi:hypothetical protein